MPSDLCQPDTNTLRNQPKRRLNPGREVSATPAFQKLCNQRNQELTQDLPASADPAQ